jgi:hypothetical protein
LLSDDSISSQEVVAMLSPKKRLSMVIIDLFFILFITG